jgi:prepilin-type N-terminal cleavage/methylation domain-containing protein
LAKSRPAFTLFEMVLVLALLVVLAALTYPSLDTMYGDYRVQAAADQVRGQWAEARTRAVNEGRAYRFAVVRNRGNFRIAPDSPEFWSGGAGASDSVMVVEDALPRGIRFTFGNGNSEPLTSDTILQPEAVGPDLWTSVVTFLPDGTATALDGNEQGEVRVIFQARNAATVLLKLRTLTGTASVQTLPPGELLP